jgi:cobalt-zinc-cadmium efflux system membrane fusion protein
MRAFGLFRAVVAIAVIGGCGDESAPRPIAEASEAVGQPAAGDWCAEHALPESMCTKCDPSLIARFREAGDFCEEHGFPESVCPICHPQAPPAGAAGDATLEARTVRFRAPTIEEAAGIRTTPARLGEAAPSVACTARIAFDGDRVADVRAIVPGVVRRVRAELGARVEEGAPLFDLESAQIAEIQGVLNAARERVSAAEADLARKRDLVQDRIASQRSVDLAEQELSAARAEARSAAATLRMAGAARAAPSGRYTLTAPLAGTVVHRPGVVGALATENTSLATLADTSMMWALCEVPEGDAAKIALGQAVEVRVTGVDDAVFEGEITYIAAEVDPRTRTVTARAEVPNPSGQLRANQFAQATIETSARRRAVTVPRAAVQRVGAREVVFVRTAAGVYEPRVVRRTGGGDEVQVEGDVHEGDAVVTTGAVLLRTEVMPGSIGAGCCEVGAEGGD